MTKRRKKREAEKNIAGGKQHILPAIDLDQRCPLLS
jgi:hypothetical protein